ncbi:hypothetical protein EON62_03140, partial [archaeon]
MQIFGADGSRLQGWVDLLPSHINCATLDARGRKVVTGLHDGRIMVHNHSTGALLKVAETNHTREVSGLTYVRYASCLVSSSWDRSIIVHADTSPSVLGTVRVIPNAHNGDILCVAASESEDVGLIMSGGNDFAVRFHDFFS